MNNSMIRNITTIMLAVAMAVTLSCSSNSPTDPEQKPTITDLSISPTHAVPMYPISISGLSIDTSEASTHRIFFGEYESIISPSESGEITTLAPLCFDTASNWHLPPDENLDVLIYRNDTLIAQALNIFSSDSLIAAPNTSSNIVVDLLSMGDAIKGILNSFTLEPGVQDQIFFALKETIDSLFIAEELQATLDTLSLTPEELALIDALLDGSGYNNTIAELTDAFEALNGGLSSLNKSTRVTSFDSQLAKMMQLAALLDEYTKTYIKGTNTGISNINSGISGSIIFDHTADIVGELKFANKLYSAITKTLLFLDLILSKFIVAGLPTQLDSITVRFGEGAVNFGGTTTASIQVGDTTVSSIRIWASSNPPPFTASDIITILMQFAGKLPFGENSGKLSEDALKRLNYLLGVLKKALGAYKKDNPEFGYDPGIVDLFSIPKNEWHATIENPTLVQLNRAVGTDVVNVLQDELEWQGVTEGNTTVNVEPVSVSESGIGLFPGIGIPVPFVYEGSSFGVLDDGEAFVSDNYTISVGNELFVNLSFPSTIHRDSTEILTVTAGTKDAGGAEFATPDLDVTINVSGGLASPGQGLTDGFGQFESEITPGASSDTVVIEVVVSDDNDQQIAKTIRVVVESESTIGFTPLGSIGFINIRDLSPDGSVVLGSAGAGAATWSKTDGLQEIIPNVNPKRVAANGMAVCGEDSNRQAFIWTPAGGIELIPLLSGGHASRAEAISDDGSAVAGHGATEQNGNSGSQGYIWSSGGTLQTTGWFPSDSTVPQMFRYTTLLHGLSGDGTVAVGYARYQGVTNAIKFTGGNMTRLPNFGGDDSLFAHARDVSFDGSIITGTCDNLAVKWQNGSISNLGTLPGHDKSTGGAVSGDGSLIFGGSQNSSAGISRGYVWDSGHGMRDLQTVLETQYGMNLTGWTSIAIIDISHDGSVMLGVGQNPSGAVEHFLLEIDPSVMLGE